MISKLRLHGTSVSEVGVLAGWGVLYGSSPFTHTHLFACFLFFYLWLLLGVFCLFFLFVCFLHSGETTLIKRSGFSQLYHSKFSARARGAAILIQNNILFEAEDVIADSTGQFVIVSGTLCHTKVILASIYAPNWDDEHFISRIFTSIPNVETYHIIIGGDFNFVQNADLDRSSNRPHSLTKSAKLLASFAEELDVSDPWRRKFPEKNVFFSFYSHVHHTYSRIDFFSLR